jgi:hypothetical protein
MPKESLEASAPPGPALAQASRVQVPQVAVPAARLLVLVPVALLLALVPGPVLVAQLLAPVPEQASALVLVLEPGLQPSVALAPARAPRLCAHT